MESPFMFAGSIPSNHLSIHFNNNNFTLVGSNQIERKSEKTKRRNEDKLTQTLISMT